MWASIINIILGLWLILSPSVLGMTRAAANNNHITGPLVITFAVIALWDINRNAAKVNCVIGAWLLIALLILNYTSTTGIVSNAISAIAILIFSLVKRKTKQRFGGGWKSLFQKEPLHLKEAIRKRAQDQA